MSQSRNFWGVLKLDIEIFRTSGRGTISVDAVEAMLDELRQAKAMLKSLAGENQTVKEWLDARDEVKGYRV